MTRSRLDLDRGDELLEATLIRLLSGFDARLMTTLESTRELEPRRRKSALILMITKMTQEAMHLVEELSSEFELAPPSSRLAEPAHSLEEADPELAMFWSMADVIEAIFRDLEGCFAKSDPALRWRDLYITFLADLSGAADAAAQA